MTDDDLHDDRERDEADHVDPDLPSENDGNLEGGPVLTPEELDFSNSSSVEELDDSGRYVVSADGDSPKVSQTTGGPGGTDTDRRGGTAGRPPGELPGGTSESPEAARSVLDGELQRTNARYALDIVARLEGEPVRHRTVSNDVVATFENLVRWYAQHVTDSTPTDEVVEILLREASFDAEPATSSLAELLADYDLEQSDSIAELVEAISSELDEDE